MVEKVTLEEMHQCMGHISYLTVRRMVKNRFVEGVELKNINVDQCETCIFAKQSREPIPKVCQGKCTQSLREHVHSDVWGLVSTESKGRKCYFVTFTDDSTRLTHLFLLHLKSHTFQAYQQYVVLMKNIFGVTIQIFHSDGGSKYMSKEFKAHLCDNRIVHCVTIHDTPKENGIAERLNLILLQ
jgi:hypothetical protein